MLCAPRLAAPCAWAREASTDPAAQVFPFLFCGCEDSQWVLGAVALVQLLWPQLSHPDREEAKVTGKNISQT